VARFAPAALLAALLVATAAAFAYTERLKLTPSPIFRTEVDKLFSPTCECSTDNLRIRFRLRAGDRITVSIVTRRGTVVRTLVEDRRQPRGSVTVLWNGRDDLGQVVADGTYKPRVRLALNRRTITLPNRIVVDTTAPHVELRRLTPRVFSPDGDGRADRIVVGYRLSERARVALYVDGDRAVLKKGSKTEGTLDWFGKVDGRRADTGVHRLVVVARDLAGNLSSRTPTKRVVLRYIALGRKRVVVIAGARFALFVSADARLVEWHLAGRIGQAHPGTLRLRAPLQPGRYTLTLREHGHAARATVIVRPAPQP
jgi:FlgD Ig-like domain